eukprot:TRINITY_DN54870_c0_g1_i1.p1 TRINITY_DN54870_c0_g1~~TRINITY_DN54870_c0_g1_i1.p1  ORF type:complete len:380 (-),score=167.43 TRINITY_DN54870_c0_g1_i1:111-1250(-)
MSASSSSSSPHASSWWSAAAAGFAVGAGVGAVLYKALGASSGASAASSPAPRSASASSRSSTKASASTASPTSDAVSPQQRKEDNLAARERMARRLEQQAEQKDSVEGKVAIVTGSTSGIGLGVALALAKQGCKVVISGSRTAKRASDVIDKVCAASASFHGGDAQAGRESVLYVRANLTDLPHAAENLIDSTVKRFGTVHILVNNAGIQHVAPTDEFPVDKWNDVLAINLSSAFHTIRLALPHMKNNEDAWGRIINISSVHGVVASVNKCAYISAKHGMNGLTKVVALETARDTNITCNAICPGWVYTPLVDKQIQKIEGETGLGPEEAVVKLLSVKQPRPRFTTVYQIGQMVLFLCSEVCANITGSQQVVDGAWSAQ